MPVRIPRWGFRSRLYVKLLSKYLQRSLYTPAGVRLILKHRRTTQAIRRLQEALSYVCRLTKCLFCMNLNNEDGADRRRL